MATGNDKQCSECGASIDSGSLCGACQAKKSLGEIPPPKDE